MIKKSKEIASNVINDVLVEGYEAVRMLSVLSEAECLTPKIVNWLAEQCIALDNALDKLKKSAK